MMRTLRCLGLLPFLLSLTVAVHAANGTSVSTMPEGPRLGAGAAFGPRGRLWVVTVDAGHVLLRHSDDLGKTYDAPVMVNAEPENIQATRENRPQVAVGPRGQLYVAWAESLGHWVSDVRFARSLDGGRHFSEPVTVNHDNAKITHSFASLTLARDGDPVIAWLDSRGMAAAMAAHEKYQGLAVYYTWSADGGKTFAPDHKLTDHSCECCRIALAREPGGSVVTFFRAIYGDSVRDHALGVLSLDGDVSATPVRATYSGWRVAACPEQGPGLAIGADRVRHAVWYEGRDGPHIWYGQLDPGHAPRHKLLIGGPGASHADVAVDGRTVWVAWNQVSARGYALKLRVSRDDGDSFGKPRTIAESGVAVYSPQLLVEGGRAYVAWNTSDGFRLIPVAGP